MTYAVAYTNINGDPIYQLDRVTEPGGRYLQLFWTPSSIAVPDRRITRVEAHDGQGNLTQWVNYSYTSGYPASTWTLTGVAYADGTSAAYTWVAGGPVVGAADDVRYNGPMRQIKYQWRTGLSGRIASENNFVTGEAVSSLSASGDGLTATEVETRGDGATRTLTYHTNKTDTTCNPADGKLISYTDFLGHTTSITYDNTNGDPINPHHGFIQTVTDPNGHTTTYTRQTNRWGVTQITRSADGSTIQQTFWPANGGDAESSPWYLASRTDELGHTTTYNRDANYRITDKYYPDNGYEHFVYNNFGEVTTHVRQKDANTTETETFRYDARGLKINYTDATGGYTTYSYYGANDPVGGNAWINRLKTVTHPANASGLHAAETYE